MKLVGVNQVELSYANALALVAQFESQRHAMIYKSVDGQIVAVSVVADEVHYGESELTERRSPYLAPELWAGV